VPDNVYRQFQRSDLLQTRVHAQPSVVWESGTYGTRGNMNGPSGSVSLYAGIRARSDVGSGSAGGVKVYPIDLVDTHSIDKVVGVPGQYPATAPINYVKCTTGSRPSYDSVTDTRWYEEHYRTIELLFDWHNKHSRATKNGDRSLGYELNEYDAFYGFDILHIPSIFYGRRLVPGSVRIIDYTHNVNGELYCDNGLGAMYLYNGAGLTAPYDVHGDFDEWQATSIFYDEGLVVVRESYHDWIGRGALSSSDGTRLRVEFSGSTYIQSMVFMCRMGPGEANMSNSPSWTPSAGKTYVTSLGLYNEERELVAVAKIAQPIRKREQDNIDIRLRLDI
jgi:hypothetical protein